MTPFLLVTPLVLQGLVMAVDEWIHRRRGLPRWERIGHPLDTLTVLVAIVFLLVCAPTSGNVAVYICLAIFSSVFVTKDERVHTAHCGAGEHWLHALLFVLHPVMFASLGLAWPALHPPAALVVGIADDAPALATMVHVQAGLTVAFLLYQAAYWNGPWAPPLPPSPSAERS